MFWRKYAIYNFTSRLRLCYDSGLHNRLSSQKKAMSIVGLIVVGDATSHGGVVVTGDPTWTVDGIPVARVGDTVFCPLCQRTTVIVSSRFASLP
jgi:hypothetical protein